jgi:hypothetical protein
LWGWSGFERLPLTFGYAYRSQQFLESPMAYTQYCWRCKLEIPMLNESEWALLFPLLTNAIEDIKKYRTEHGVSLAEARANGYGTAAVSAYLKMTGFRETNAEALWHHRLSLYGPACKNCQKPLRTPRASHCAECGTNREHFVNALEAYRT